MNRKPVDLIAVGVLAALAIASTHVLPSGNIARALLTLPLALFLPGYALTAALFPGRSLGGPERSLFSFGLSLTLTILGGLVLHWMSLPLWASSWAVMLGTFTLVLALVALLRNWYRPVATTTPLRPRPIQLGQMLLALLLAVGALQLSRNGAEIRRDGGFTQLWMLPSNQSSTERVRLGIGNYETQSMRYRLRVSAGDTVLGEWQQVELGPDQQWEAQLNLPAQSSAPTVEATLYRLDAPETIYRHVIFWRGEQQ